MPRWTRILKLLLRWLFLALSAGAFSAQPDSDLQHRGRQFFGFDSFASFTQKTGSSSNEKILLSPEIRPKIPFNEVVVSWNAETPAGSYLIIEAQAIYPDSPTKFYALGRWSTDPARNPRQSVPNQKDANGDVATDVLILRRPADRLRIRLHFDSDKTVLKFLGISVTDTNAALTELHPNTNAWGKLVDVPERSQMIYPNGKALCSPTTVSMLLAYWAGTLNRPQLDRPVPQIVEAIYDSQWQGTGNWPFNMAYAGSFPGMRAYVARLSDVSELESWICKDMPVGLSVDYDRLRAKGPGPNGHLVVCVGFTKEGDPIINDPGTSNHVRKVFPRKNLIDAWACSKNTVYLVYPESASTPDDPLGHWDSPTSRAWNSAKP